MAAPDATLPHSKHPLFSNICHSKQDISHRERNARRKIQRGLREIVCVCVCVCVRACVRAWVSVRVKSSVFKTSLFDPLDI